VTRLSELDAAEDWRGIVALESAALALARDVRGTHPSVAGWIHGSLGRGFCGRALELHAQCKAIEGEMVSRGTPESTNSGGHINVDVESLQVRGELPISAMRIEGVLGRHRRSPLRPYSTHKQAMPSDATGLQVRGDLPMRSVTNLSVEEDDIHVDFERLPIHGDLPRQLPSFSPATSPHSVARSVVPWSESSQV